MGIFGQEPGDEFGSPSGRGFASDAANAAKEYMKKSELDRKELDAARESQKVEKRRINEKQIRALRNNYRPSGGLLNQGSTLGSSGDLPTKLGS